MPLDQASPTSAHISLSGVADTHPLEREQCRRTGQEPTRQAIEVWRLAPEKSHELSGKSAL